MGIPCYYMFCLSRKSSVCLTKAECSHLSSVNSKITRKNKPGFANLFSAAFVFTGCTTVDLPALTSLPSNVTYWATINLSWHIVFHRSRVFLKLTRSCIHCWVITLNIVWESIRDLNISSKKQHLNHYILTVCHWIFCNIFKFVWQEMQEAFTSLESRVYSY